MSALPVTTPDAALQPAEARTTVPALEAVSAAPAVVAPQADAANSASITLPAAANEPSLAEAPSRAPVQPPETRSSALLPPENPPVLPPTAPKPVLTVRIVAAHEVAPTGHDAKALRIEQNIARFIGDRLPAEFRTGLMVDVVLANSNAVTTEGPGSHDIAIIFKGGELENPKNAEKVAAMLRGALREHPAFEGMSFGGIDEKIEHLMRCQILSLDAEQMKHLLAPQPAKHTTFVSASEAANDAATPVAPTPVNTPIAPSPAIMLQVNPAPQAAATHICNGNCSHSPAVQPVATVLAPANYQGLMAANQAVVGVM